MNTKSKRILVVDDDPTFRHLVKRLGAQYRLEIVTCGSIQEISAVGGPNSFDAMIVDYFLDNVDFKATGVELARALEGVPTILVSHSDHCVNNQEDWPLSVRGFYPKKVGVNKILQEARSLSNRRELV